MVKGGVAAPRPLGCLLSLCFGEQPRGSTEDPEYDEGDWGFLVRGISLEGREEEMSQEGCGPRTVPASPCQWLCPSSLLARDSASRGGWDLPPVRWCSWSCWGLERSRVCRPHPSEQLVLGGSQRAEHISLSTLLQRLGGSRWAGTCWRGWGFGGVGKELVFTLSGPF